MKAIIMKNKKWIAVVCGALAMILVITTSVYIAQGNERSRYISEVDEIIVTMDNASVNFTRFADIMKAHYEITTQGYTFDLSEATAIIEAVRLDETAIDQKYKRLCDTRPMGFNTNRAYKKMVEMYKIYTNLSKYTFDPEEEEPDNYVRVIYEDCAKIDRIVQEWEDMN